MRTDDLDFKLPPELIAQTPASDRAASRLLHYRRETRQIEHRAFTDLPHLLRRGDVLVFNDAKVIPARFALRKNTGGRVEGLFLSENEPGRWGVLLKNPGPSPVGMMWHFESDANLTATVLESRGDGEYLLAVNTPDAIAVLDRVGRMPLPPYIHRDKRADDRDDLDRARYQTVYARTPGAVAAPTAGLHFTPEILSQLDAAGIQRAMVTLDVGVGTFRPVNAANLQEHVMHSERYEIPPTTADILNQARREKRRIIAIGTTSARVLESQAADASIPSGAGTTSIFIFPPYRWKNVDALITNFHLPRSTLIALVAALVGLEEQRRIYREAIERGYRFFSYGDAMLVE